MSGERSPGYAVLAVSQSFFQEAGAGPDSALLGLDFCDLQGHIRAAGAFDEAHRLLCLPETYSIVGLFWQWLQHTWSVVVSSQDLPPNEVGFQLPHLRATYRLSGPGVRVLVHLEVVTQPQLSRVYQMCSRCFEGRDLVSDEVITDALGQRVYFCQRCWDGYLAQEAVLIVQ